MGPKLVGLIRVSTDKQGKSGLGLEAQEAAIERYRNSIRGRLLKTYVEIESGTHDDVDSRPQLKEAVAHAQRSRATLVIAKIDRLVRSKVVAAYLTTNKVRFVACDNPHANELTIDILVAVAADEARRISERTTAALKAYREGRHVSKRIKEKYDGKVPPEVIEATAGKLGAQLAQCQGHLTPEAREKGWKKSVATRKAAMIAAYGILAPRMLAMWESGLSLRQIADQLNQDELEATDDDEHQAGDEDELEPAPTWSAMKVKRVLDRFHPDRTRVA
jgi:DNA invertase Pin-like site-specific DNA recombinase